MAAQQARQPLLAQVELAPYHTVGPGSAGESMSFER